MLTLMGVSRLVQFYVNVASLDIELTMKHRALLDGVSAQTDPKMLYILFSPTLRQHGVFGGSSVQSWRR